MLEAAVVVTGDLATDTRGLVDLDEVGLRVGVDGNLALCADDLGHVVLTRSHHAARVEVGNLAAPELDDTDSIVDVAELAELRTDGGDARGDNRLGLTVLAKVPEGEVNVVDVAVDKDAAAKLGVADPKVGRVKPVARLGAKD